MRAARFDPGNEQAHCGRAQALYGLGRLKRALAAIDRAAAAKPEDMSVHFVRGGILHALGRLDEAAAALGEAGRLDPGNRHVAAALDEMRRGGFPGGGASPDARRKPA